MTDRFEGVLSKEQEQGLKKDLLVTFADNHMNIMDADVFDHMLEKYAPKGVDKAVSIDFERKVSDMCLSLAKIGWEFSGNADYKNLMASVKNNRDNGDVIGVFKGEILEHRMLEQDKRDALRHRDNPVVRKEFVCAAPVDKKAKKGEQISRKELRDFVKKNLRGIGAVGPKRQVLAQNVNVSAMGLKYNKYR